ncbi:hypothetical protein MN116_001590 [Schistosoma mekongi]|uniref:Complex I-15 kDa n=1 Tax=Schistosoma mekongi TaxID=38744 RepID=A0AAE1ZJC6_SCHME|nr:hypothetical protein MN116_001590 [Schistosoma mekongi]
MASVVTNPDLLNHLNDEARLKENRKLPVAMRTVQPLEEFLRKVYGGKRPFEAEQGFPITYKLGGNFLHRPIIDVPKLQMGVSWFTMQSPFKPRFCQIMERDFFRCVSRVGLQNTDKLCKIYWEDLVECQNHDKARKRALMMEKVRKLKKVAPMTNVPYSAYQDPNF